MEWSSYCAVCNNFLNRPNEVVPSWANRRELPPVKYLRPQIASSAESGCCFCLLLFGYLGGRRELFTDDFPSAMIHLYENAGPENRYLAMELLEDGPNAHPGFTSISLRPRTGSHERPAMINEPSHDPHERAFVTVTPSSVTGRASTGDELCMNTIRYWLEGCLRDHKLCRNSLDHQQSKRLPTRLIDLDGAGQPRLFLTEEIGADSTAVKYVTLSHRWSKDRHLTLLQGNMEQLRSRIDIASLPLVFQDTITVLRSLRIRYLWIDCLCILQDSLEDWERESSLMGQVYENAFCNLGATEAASRMAMAEYPKRPLRLFAERNPHSIFPTAIRIARKGRPSSEYFAYSYTIGKSPTNMGLMSRGWVFQERLLSPRSIYFDSQLTWECAEIVACEAFPDGVPVQTTVNTLDEGMPVRLASFLSSTEAVKSLNGMTGHQTALYCTWLKLVQEYSTCDLSYTTDMFPALSGLAKAFAQSLHDDYIAGLWRKDLLRGLLWVGRKRDLLPGEYIAPSWSWASHCRVMFGVLLESPDEYFQKPICQLNDAQVTLHGSDPMGRISSGRITLTGHMRKTQAGKRKMGLNTDQISLLDFSDYYDSVTLKDDASSCEDSYHFVVTYHAAWRQVLGLILQPASIEGEFRRIGAFTHPFGHADGVVTQHPEWPPRPVVRENFPEFAFFYPDNLELQTVTII